MTRKLAYLATPFTLFSDGHRVGYGYACKAAGNLIARGYDVYSPIVHAVAICDQTDLNPLDHALWMRVNERMMEACDEIWVVQMPGWEESRGIAIEREAFRAAGKLERMVSWPGLEVG